MLGQHEENNKQMYAQEASPDLVQSVEQADIQQITEYNQELTPAQCLAEYQNTSDQELKKKLVAIK